MKRISFFVLSLIALSVLFSSCGKNCVCHARDGHDDYFTPQELEALGVECQKMVEWNLGLKYSQCEHTNQDGSNTLNLD